MKLRRRLRPQIRGRALRSSVTLMFLICVQAKSSSIDSSRPMPDCLYSAERDADVMRARAVDPYVTRFDARRKAMRAVEVVRPDRRGEAVIERVDAREHVVLVRPAQDRHHRPEDLLARDAHVVGDVGEHGRLDEEPAGELRIAGGACRRRRAARRLRCRARCSSSSCRTAPGSRGTRLRCPARRAARP